MIKTLYMLWFQGFDNSPEIIKKCAQSWKHYNPDLNIVLLDNNNLNDYIKVDDYIEISKKALSHAALSDIIRISLLRKHGGLWVDATTFCNKPLNEWLPNYINEGFFAFSKPGRDRLLSSWFLYSEKGSITIEKWFQAVIQYYLAHDAPQAYFWLHYLFGDLYKSDGAFKEIWDKVPVLSANGMGPHYLQQKGICCNISQSVKGDIDSKVTPLYKLNHRFIYKNKNSNLYYLYSTLKK